MATISDGNQHMHSSSRFSKYGRGSYAFYRSLRLAVYFTASVSSAAVLGAISSNEALRTRTRLGGGISANKESKHPTDTDNVEK